MATTDIKLIILETQCGHLQTTEKNICQSCKQGGNQKLIDFELESILYLDPWFVSRLSGPFDYISTYFLSIYNALNPRNKVKSKEIDF